MFNKEVIYVKDVMYFVKRKIHNSLQPIIDDWKQHLNCDIVFIRDDIYYFCETVQEAQIIENE